MLDGKDVFPCCGCHALRFAADSMLVLSVDAMLVLLRKSSLPTNPTEPRTAWLILGFCGVGLRTHGEDHGYQSHFKRLNSKTL